MIAILGTIIPYIYFVQFLLAEGLDVSEFFYQITNKPISSFFTWDVVISTLATITLVFTEGKRMKMKNLWVYVVFNLVVGVSLALPAFLYSRQLKLDQTRH